MSSRTIKYYLMALSLAAALAPPSARAGGLLRVPTDFPTLQAALNQVGDGDTIELAADIYTPPAGGWLIASPAKSFTVRGEAGGVVTLDGGGTSQILRLDFVTQSSIVFENLVFANGFSSTDARAGGVSVDHGSIATFIDCVFRDNESRAPTTGGGGVALFRESTGHFFNCRFEGNIATNEGGGLRVGAQSRAFVHGSEFVANLTNVPGHRDPSAGAGIHVTNSTVRISNTRFEANESGCIGGGIYALGGFSEAVTEVTVVNSTFVDNVVVAQPDVVCGEVGAGIHVENNVNLDIYSSRFLTNTAKDGGAINLERATIDIHDSVFRGNLATGDDKSAGGVIAGSSGDKSSDAINFPSARITIRDSLFQGRFESVGPTARRGGCLSLIGDTRRTYGTNGVAQMGDASINRATLDIARTIFADCDAAESASSGTGMGGAMDISHTDLSLTDSLIIDSDALGTGSKGWGGGIRAINESVLTLVGTTFANNTASFQSAAVHASGSDIHAEDCQFIGNRVLSGSTTVGHVITAAVTLNSIPGHPFGAAGEVRDSTFSDNGAPAMSDGDNADGPVNEVVYLNNQIHSPAGSDVYRNTLEGNFTASELNSLVVVRNVGTPTDKGTNNQALGIEPVLGAILANPPAIVPSQAAGDPPPASEAFVAYAGSGGTLVLDGSPTAEPTGLEPSPAGMKVLVIGSQSFVDDIADSPDPDAAFVASPVSIPGGAFSNLSWSTTIGTFLDLSIDRGLEIATPAAAGSLALAPLSTTTYNLHLLTEQGGVFRQATIFVDEQPPLPPGSIFADGFESGDTNAW